MLEAALDTATAAGYLQALGNPIRLRICEILIHTSDDGLTVGRVQSCSASMRPPYRITSRP